MKLTKPNCALAQKSVGKKIFNYGQVSTNITTKNRPKHGLYTMLCFRFNEAQLCYMYTKGKHIKPGVEIKLTER